MFFLNLNAQCTQEEMLFNKQKKIMATNLDRQNILDSTTRFKNSKCKDIVSLRIRCFTALHQFKEAYEEIKHLEKIDKTLSSPNNYTIAILIEQKKNAEALKEIEICLKKASTPSEKIGLIQRRVVVRNCEIEAECNERLNDFLEIYALDNKDWINVYNLIKEEIRLNKLEKINEHLATFYKLNNETIYYYDALNQIFFRLNQYEKCLELSKNLIQKFPKSANYYNNTGLSFAYLNQFDSALYFVNKAIDLKPDFALAWNNRGFIKILMNQYQNAISDLEKSIELDKKLPHPYNNLGYIYTKLKSDSSTELSKKYYDYSIKVGGKGYQPYWKY